MGCYRMRVQETRGRRAKGDGVVRAWKDLHNFHPASVRTADTHLGSHLQQTGGKNNIPLACPPRYDLGGNKMALFSTRCNTYNILLHA